MSTLSQLLETHNQSKVARQIGHANSKKVNAWVRERSVPDVSDLPPLAAVLRMDIGELTRIVAEDARRIASRQDAHVA